MAKKTHSTQVRESVNVLVEDLGFDVFTYEEVELLGQLRIGFAGETLSAPLLRAIDSAIAAGREDYGTEHGIRIAGPVRERRYEHVHCECCGQEFSRVVGRRGRPQVYCMKACADLVSAVKKMRDHVGLAVEQGRWGPAMVRKFKSEMWSDLNGWSAQAFDL